MLKRKDWYLHNSAEASDTDGSSPTSSAESELQAGRSSTPTKSSPSKMSLQDEADIDCEMTSLRSIEDISEDDFDGGSVSEVDDEAVNIQQQWLAAGKSSTMDLIKAALRCRLCKGVLILGPASLKQHLMSKKHISRLGRKSKGYQPICLASGRANVPELETHQDRIDRVKAEAERSKFERGSGKKQKTGHPLKKGKLGRRERAESKATVVKQLFSGSSAFSVSEEQQAQPKMSVRIQKGYLGSKDASGDGDRMPGLVKKALKNKKSILTDQKAAQPNRAARRRAKQGSSKT